MTTRPVYRVTRTGRTWSVIDLKGQVVEGGFFTRSAAVACCALWNLGAV